MIQITKSYYRGFTIVYNPKPGPAILAYDWDYDHDEYDGPGDPRYGYAKTLTEAKREIDELLQIN